MLMSEKINDELEGLEGSIWNNKVDKTPKGAQIADWEAEVQRILAEMETVKVEG